MGKGGERGKEKYAVHQMGVASDWCGRLQVD